MTHSVLQDPRAFDQQMLGRANALALSRAPAFASHTLQELAGATRGFVAMRNCHARKQVVAAALALYLQEGLSYSRGLEAFGAATAPT